MGKDNNLQLSNKLFSEILLKRNLILNRDIIYEVSNSFLDSISINLYRQGHEIIVLDKFNKEHITYYQKDDLTFIYNGDTSEDLLEFIRTCIDYNSFNIGICTDSDDYDILKEKYKILRDKIKLLNENVSEREECIDKHKAYILSFRK